MKSLGHVFKGKVYIQILSQKPPWTIEDRGRIIFSINDNISYIGGSTGWTACSLHEDVVKASHIDWNTEMLDGLDKVSSKDIPCTYEDQITNLQLALNSLRTHILNLQNGSEIQDGTILARHINLNTDKGFTAGSLLFRDIHGCLSDSTYTYSLEDALNLLCQRRADKLYLAENNEFGALLGFTGKTVQDSLVDLEQFVAALKAKYISCQFYTLDYPDEGSCQTMNLQTALDRIHSKFKTGFSITELSDVQHNYGQCGQYLKSCGQYEGECCDFQSGIHARWANIQANEVKYTFINYKANSCGVPYNTTMQYAMDWILNNNLWGIPIGYVVISPMGTVKCGYLPCLGGLYYVDDYPTLFETIGYYFGGSGSQFAVPNYYDVHLRGNRTGRAYHSYESDQVGPHTHPIDMGWQPVAQGGEWAWGDRQFSPEYQNTLSSGGSETKVRNRSVLYVIRAY